MMTQTDGSCLLKNWSIYPDSYISAIDLKKKKKWLTIWKLQDLRDTLSWEMFQVAKIWAAGLKHLSIHVKKIRRVRI